MKRKARTFPAFVALENLFLKHPHELCVEFRDHLSCTVTSSPSVPFLISFSKVWPHAWVRRGDAGYRDRVVSFSGFYSRRLILNRDPKGAYVIPAAIVGRQPVSPGLFHGLSMDLPRNVNAPVPRVHRALARLGVVEILWSPSSGSGFSLRPGDPAATSLIFYPRSWNLRRWLQGQGNAMMQRRNVFPPRACRPFPLLRRFLSGASLH